MSDIKIFSKSIPLVLASLLFSPIISQAMDFITGNQGDADSDKNVKFSSCIWTSNWNFPDTPLPGKPGVNDNVKVRKVGYDAEIDINNPTYRSLSIGETSTLSAVKKNIKLKGNLMLSVTPIASSETLGNFDNCNIDIGGGIEFTTWQYAKMFGRARLMLKDTRFNAKGPISFMMSSNVFNQSDPAGFDFDLKGNTILNVNGGTLIDPIIPQNPDSWNITVRFTPENGKYPCFTINGNADLSGALYYVNVPEDIAPGKFNLLILNSSKGTLGNSPKFYINSKQVKPDETIQVGKRKVTLRLTGAGKNSKPANDLILEIK